MSRQEILTSLLLDDTFRAWVLSDRQEHSQHWEQWRFVHSEDIELLEEAREILLEWQADQEKLPDNRKEVLRQKILTIAQSERTAYAHPRKPWAENPVWMWARIAAAVSIVVIGSLLLYIRVGDQPEAGHYATTFGEIKTFRLPDSSQVTLNGNSSLQYQYNKKQNSGSREVWLTGEAFFEVSKQRVTTQSGEPQDVKFIVHTDNLSVQVLGTRFNVRHRRDQTQVVLEEGSVQLQLPEQTQALLMSPDELVEVHKGTSQINQKPVRANDYIAWKEGVIHFEGASFEEINRVLEDNYDITLYFEKQEQAEAINLQGTFPANHIDILLEAIANVTHTTINKKGNTIIYQ